MSDRDHPRAARTARSPLMEKHTMNARMATRTRDAWRGLLSVAALALLMAGCSGDGAGAGGGLPGYTQGEGSGGDPTGSAQILVSNAVPTSGNGTVVMATGTATPSPNSSLVTLSVKGVLSGGSTQHVFTVLYDTASQMVVSANHAWGAPGALAQGSTDCVLQQSSASASNSFCLTVAVQPAAGQMSFQSTYLESSNGLNTSLLNGTARFTPF
jgi:hypothetical protein